MKRLLLILALLLPSAPLPAQDNSINYNSLNRQGLDGVAQLLQQMTPQQREQVLQQARAQLADLEKMTPQQRQLLIEQMQNIAATIDFNKVDPAKLDPSKAKGVRDSQKNVLTYQRRYEQGQIKNGVVMGPSKY